MEGGPIDPSSLSVQEGVKVCTYYYQCDCFEFSLVFVSIIRAIAITIGLLSEQF